MALKPSTIRRLNEADTGYRDAWQEREDAIVAAWEQNPGCSVREIADAVGLTHTAISKVLARRGVRKIGKIDWDPPGR